MEGVHSAIRKLLSMSAKILGLTWAMFVAEVSIANDISLIRTSKQFQSNNCSQGMQSARQLGILSCQSGARLWTCGTGTLPPGACWKPWGRWSVMRPVPVQEGQASLCCLLILFFGGGGGGCQTNGEPQKRAAKDVPQPTLESSQACHQKLSR